MTEPTPSLEDVLDAFAVEPHHDRETLERFLRAYPQYALELVDHSRELSRDLIESGKPLSPTDESLIEAAWKKHLEQVQETVVDPLGKLSVEGQRELAAHLGVPRQIVSAFRERRVALDSVPVPFLKRFAEKLGTTVETLLSTLALPPANEEARSYKALGKPESDSSIQFEQLLIDAGVPEEMRSLFMESDK